MFGQFFSSGYHAHCSRPSRISLKLIKMLSQNGTYTLLNNNEPCRYYVHNVFVLCLCGIECMSLPPAKAFNIEFFSLRKYPTNANYYYYHYFWLATLLHNNLSNGYETHIIYCCMVHIRNTRSRLQSSLYSIYMNKYFAMCTCGTKVHSRYTWPPFFVIRHLIYGRQILIIKCINIIYSCPVNTKMSTSTAATDVEMRSN